MSIISEFWNDSVVHLVPFQYTPKREPTTVLFHLLHNFLLSFLTRKYLKWERLCLEYVFVKTISIHFRFNSIKKKSTFHWRVFVQLALTGQATGIYNDMNTNKNKACGFQPKQRYDKNTEKIFLKGIHRHSQRVQPLESIRQSGLWNPEM